MTTRNGERRERDIVRKKPEIKVIAENPVEKAEESKGRMEDIGGEAGPAPDGVAPKASNEDKICAMAGENNVGSQAGAGESATGCSIASVAGLGRATGT